MASDKLLTLTLINRVKPLAGCPCLMRGKSKKIRVDTTRPDVSDPKLQTLPPRLDPGESHNFSLRLSPQQADHSMPGRACLGSKPGHRGRSECTSGGPKA
ncbi:Hypothetical predicted protein [Marmota monax]|uniref:Uncharacterized protein n=1 Tax=Marmota monax TaxID=9995 RepID=A0A5E4APN9_MARMO|nr:hypothetical protein GHT09_005014 [Marmota monax]VTJ59125.1 Hypothetical predicted protein [Marmota monax]